MRGANGWHAQELGLSNYRAHSADGHAVVVLDHHPFTITVSGKTERGQRTVPLNPAGAVPS